MKVFLGTPRGFCAGVVRAIDVVEIALERFGSPVYVKHQIVHNPYVANSLEAKGAITVEDVEDIPEGATEATFAGPSPRPGRRRGRPHEQGCSPGKQRGAATGGRGGLLAGGTGRRLSVRGLE